MTTDGTPEDDKLDEAIEESFPASDPPSNTVETGIQVETGPTRRPELVVRDNPEASRFEVVVDGQVAFLRYARTEHAFVLVHTEVPDSLRGRGVGDELARFGLAAARSESRPLRVLCPFVRAYLQRHPEEGQPGLQD